MYNKESCRKCGFNLEQAKECKVCDEILLWFCKKCQSYEDRYHLHYKDNDLLTKEMLVVNL